MRSLSVLTSFTAAACLVMLYSCASAPPEIRPKDSSVILEGLVGHDDGPPFSRNIFLTDSTGTRWRLLAGWLEAEMLGLSGLPLRIEGGYDAEGGTVTVDAYEPLPVDGRIPLVGMLVVEDGRLLLLHRGTRDRYEIAGPLVNTLIGFKGCRVWIIGEVPAAGTGEGSGNLILEAEGYGVFECPTRPLNPPPAPDTLRDS